MSLFRLRAAALAAASMIVAHGAAAAESFTPFVSLDISAGQPYDDTTTGGFATDMGMQLGYSIGAGVRVGPVMVEMQYEEHTFFLNNLNPIGGATLPATDYEGDVDYYALTTQVAMEFGGESAFRPYVGIAGGIASLSADYYENICTLCTPGAQFVAESDYAIVWSGTVGLTFDSDGAGEYYIGYRHLRTHNFNLATVGGAPFQQQGLRSDSIELGIRVPFN